jgi:aspartyl/asparaginyl-tRNA synthetase
MRNENPDKRHLNQFFHCEAEMRGTWQDSITLAEELLKHLCETMLELASLLLTLGSSSDTISAIKSIAADSTFKKITFDEACNLLDNSSDKYIYNTSSGRDITPEGELKLTELVSPIRPIWITHYDRDRVPFYLKPLEGNTNHVLNADLIFPSIAGGFGGEIIGSGERQDSAIDMYESLSRQQVSPNSYKWYIDLRNQPTYRTTSGFGLGIERLIAWLISCDDIRTTIPYPRLKNTPMAP